MFVTLGRKIKWDLTSIECDDAAVWVSVAKLENNWRDNASEYIGPGGSGNAITGRYANFGEWAKNHKRVQMPEICLVGGQVRISNGRHRFSWLRDHGMVAMQIQVPSNQVNLFQQKFGTDIRSSEWFEAKQLQQKAQ